MLDKITIDQYFDSFAKNFRRFKESFPEAFRSADEVNAFFWQLYKIDYLRKTDIFWQQTTQEMLFGCLISWVNSFVNASSGLEELAQTSARRAIEFVCYISKINDSDKRADLWARQRQDEDSKRKFLNEFAVPRCYFSQGYKHLEKLLFLYDHYSDFGTHANLSMLAQKKKEDGSLFTDIVFDEFRYIPMNVNTKIYLGYLIIKSILLNLKDLSVDYRALFDKLEDLHVKVNLADAEIIFFEAEMGIEPEIINNLLTKPDLFKSKFEKMKQSYLLRKK